MLTGREQETAFLENHYKRTGSQILVVYGQRGVGKTALLTSFTEKKQTLRYSAGNCFFQRTTILWGRDAKPGKGDCRVSFLAGIAGMHDNTERRNDSR